LSCFGTNGLTEEHTVAVSQLKELKEIILFFDGDQAGRESIKKHAATLHQLRPTVNINYIETPEGEDVNSLSIGHESELFTHLIDNRKTFSFSLENQLKKEAEPGAPAGNKTEQVPQSNSTLNTENPEQIIYESGTLKITIWGGIEKE